MGWNGGRFACVSQVDGREEEWKVSLERTREGILGSKLAEANRANEANETIPNERWKDRRGDPYWDVS